MKTFRTLPLALAGVVLAATVAGVAALANSNPGDPGGPAPSQRPSPTRPAAAPIRVDLANVEGRIVTVDILDRSGRVAGARSGAAGSGGSDGLRVTNLDARTLELEWSDFAVDNAVALYVDESAAGLRIVLVQPGPSGPVDAMASGRVLILTFEDAIDATAVEASLVESLDE